MEFHICVNTGTDFWPPATFLLQKYRKILKTQNLDIPLL